MWHNFHKSALTLYVAWVCVCSEVIIFLLHIMVINYLLYFLLCSSNHSFQGHFPIHSFFLLFFLLH